MLKSSNNLQFEMLGYKLLDIEYNTVDSDLFNNFTLQFSELQIKNKVATLNIKVKLGFEKKSESIFVFEFAFYLNDKALHNKLSEYDIIKVFSIEAFPFIRNSIFNVTKESSNPIMLPIIDLNNLDFKKGVEFVKK